MNGMEMMLQSVFRALGIDPEEIKRSMFDTVTKLQTGIQGLDTSLRQINARLERLEKHLGVNIETPTEAESVEDFDINTGKPTLKRISN